MDSLCASLESITIENETRNSVTIEVQPLLASDILYVSLKLNKDLINEIIDLFNLSKYDIQDEFHTTLLYTGGKENPNLDSLRPFFDTSCNIQVDKIAISSRFITLGVTKIIDNDNNEIPYFGNEIKHITIGKKKGMKLLPKDSPSSFSDGKIMIFKDIYIISGIIKLVLKNKK